MYRVWRILWCLVAILGVTSLCFGAGRGQGGGGRGNGGARGTGGQNRGGNRGGGNGARGGSQRQRGGDGARSGQRGRGAGQSGGMRGGMGQAPGRNLGGSEQYQYQHQHQYRNQGEEQGPKQHRWEYNHSEERRLSGTVSEEPGQGQGAGKDSTLQMRGEDGQLRRVQMGPPWFVNGLDLKPKPGDPIEIIGANSAGGGAINAREMNWNGQTYRLRNEEGIPLWAGAAREGWNRYADAWQGSGTEELVGKIEGMEGTSPGGEDMGRGVILRLRERDRTQGDSSQEREQMRPRVHLGPYWFVEEARLDLQPGEEITLHGSRKIVNGQEEFFATDVVYNQQHVRLRNAEGKPEWAGGWQNWDGWGPDSRYTRQFDPNRVQTQTGQIESLQEVMPFEGMGRGLALTIKTREQRRLRVHLGPNWFLEQTGVSFKPGDQVSITGAMVPINGKSVCMATELTSGNQRLRLRHRNGEPVWSGRAEQTEIQIAAP